MLLSRRLIIVGGSAIVASALAVSAYQLDDGVSQAPVVPALVVGAGSDKLHVVRAQVDSGGRLKRLQAQVVGRVAINPHSGAIEHEWPGFSAEGRFRGDAIIVRLNDPVNRLRISLDDGAAGIVEMSRVGATDLRIAGIGSGEHLVRIEKMSESPGPAEFGGFFVRDAQDVLPLPGARERLIEFLGDSDTVGYGGMSSTRNCSVDQVYASTDVTRSFGPRVAARFRANYRMLARSGVGLIRNHSGAGGEAMSTLHDRALPSEPDKPHAPEAQADLIVISVGSNDFSSTADGGGTASEARGVKQAFGPALLALARARLRESPAARIIMLAFGEYGDQLIEPYRDTATALRRQNVPAEVVVLPKLGRHSCHWHPSQDDHALISKLLERAVLRVAPEWSN